MHEGGVRSLAFVSGGLLPSDRRGKTTEGFIHIADWYTTFCQLDGVDSDDSGAGKFPVDGMNVWPILTGENEKTQHEQIWGITLISAATQIMKEHSLLVITSSLWAHMEEMVTVIR